MRILLPLCCRVVLHQKLLWCVDWGGSDAVLLVVVKQILSDKDLLALETVYCFSQPIFFCFSRYIFLLKAIDYLLLWIGWCSLHRVFEFDLFQIWNTLLWALSFLRRKGMLEGSKGRLEKVQRWFVPYPFIDGLPGSFQGNGWRLFLVGVSASFRKLSLPSHKSKKWSQKKKVTH